MPGSYFFQGRNFLLSYKTSIVSFKIIELHGRERCGEVDPAKIKKIARKNRVNDLWKRVMYFLDSLKDCALTLETTEGFRKPRLGDKGMFL